MGRGVQRVGEVTSTYKSAFAHLSGRARWSFWTWVNAGWLTLSTLLDSVSTWVGLHAGLEEVNPVLKELPTPGAIVGTSCLMTIVVGSAVVGRGRGLGQLVQWVLVVGLGLKGLVGLHNLYLLG